VKEKKKAAQPGKERTLTLTLTFEYGVPGSSGSTSSVREWRSARITASSPSSSTMPRFRPRTAHIAPVAARRAHANAPSTSTSGDAELRVARLVDDDAAAASPSAAAETLLRFLECSGDPGAAPGLPGGTSDPTMGGSPPPPARFLREWQNAAARRGFGEGLFRARGGVLLLPSFSACCPWGAASVRGAAL